jgi:hypothetical protein
MPFRRSRLWLWLKPWRVAATCVIIVVCVAWLGARPLRGQTPHLETKPDRVTGALLAGQASGQTLVAEMGGLYRVDVYFAVYGQPTSGTVVFHLKRSPAAATDLATVRVPATQIRNKQFQAFEFAPLPAALKGESLYFYVESPDSAPAQIIAAWGYAADLYPGGQAVFASATGGGAADLAFRAFYLPNAPERLAVVLNRLVEQKPWVLGWRGWYVVLGLGYLGLLLGLGWALAREARDWD